MLSSNKEDHSKVYPEILRCDLLTPFVSLERTIYGQLEKYPTEQSQSILNGLKGLENILNAVYREYKLLFHGINVSSRRHLDVNATQENFKLVIDRLRNFSFKDNSTIFRLISFQQPELDLIIQNLNQLENNFAKAISDHQRLKALATKEVSQSIRLMHFGARRELKDLVKNEKPQPVGKISSI